ncbi:hypothetical protein T492DRAFT_1082129 [Pavlovales sp. CCMP2436]|nr:hypothetical protein T492DRAFT_1082129 [Pavlovales sp. CCMP2436]|mmetsp:Transcript_16734/g.42748  ORF Transcript_16734/g.42748 Transcript_16734/m.42748 type:complete len:238 (+) Transcript_16734:66-779(+)
MTEEISYYDDELTELCGELRQKIDGLPRMSGDARAERISQLGVRMQRAKQVLHSYKVEMRELSKEDAFLYDQKCKGHLATLQKLNTDLSWAKSEGERVELMQHPGGESADTMSAQALIGRGAQIQEQSLASTARSKRLIEESRSVGVETATKLHTQTEQLRNIDEDIMKVESNLKRADMLIRAFLRRMATDKFIMVFMFLIVIGILTIIIYKAVNPKGAAKIGFNVSNNFVPPTSYK